MIIVLKDADFSQVGIGKIEINRELSGLTDILFENSAYGDIDSRLKFAIDDLVVGMKSKGLWNKLYSCYFPILSTSGSSILIDVKATIDTGTVTTLTLPSGVTAAYNSNGGMDVTTSDTNLHATTITTNKQEQDGFTLFGYSRQQIGTIYCGNDFRVGTDGNTTNVLKAVVDANMEVQYITNLQYPIVGSIRRNGLVLFDKTRQLVTTGEKTGDYGSNPQFIYNWKYANGYAGTNNILYYGIMKGLTTEEGLSLRNMLVEFQNTVDEALG
jgi:hypothetical protein